MQTNEVQEDLINEAIKHSILEQVEITLSSWDFLPTDAIELTVSLIGGEASSVTVTRRRKRDPKIELTIHGPVEDHGRGWNEVPQEGR